MSDININSFESEIVALSGNIRHVKTARHCSVEGCTRPYNYAGYCQAHGWQMRHHGVLKPIQERSYSRRVKHSCEIPLCVSLQVGAHRVCKTHQSIARAYSLSHDDYIAMYLLGCHICGRVDVPLSVDHDHDCCSEAKKSCGKCVRGLLCASDNFILGWIDKSELPLGSLLSNIARYYAYDVVVRGGQIVSR